MASAFVDGLVVLLLSAPSLLAAVEFGLHGPVSVNCDASWADIF